MHKHLLPLLSSHWYFYLAFFFARFLLWGMENVSLCHTVSSYDEQIMRQYLFTEGGEKKKQC